MYRTYHVIGCPKYQREVLTGMLARQMGAMLHVNCGQWGWLLFSKKIEPDHVHLFVSIPLATAVAGAVKVLKGITARLLLQKFPGLKKRMWGGSLCSPSHFVDTAGHVSAQTMRR